MKGEMFVVSGPGEGHLRPCMELCLHLASRNYHTTLVLSSTNTIPSYFSDHPLTSLAPISATLRMSDSLRRQSGEELEAHLSSRPGPVLCAIVDFQMGWSSQVFRKFHVPVVSFFTFGACAASLEWAAWKLNASDIRPGEARPIPGLPEEMSISHTDIKRKPMGPGRGGPPAPGSRPPWVPEIEGSVGLMFNTCDDLERPFLAYMGGEMKMPVWGVGPLLPEKYWKAEANEAEEEVIQWLDSKASGSVLYVAFGSEVEPSAEEYGELEGALEASTRPFIWVIHAKSGYVPSNPRVGCEEKRGVMIKGWAPQVAILRHRATGGFLTHCGWNSTAEGVGKGVPLLAWPIRGDQHLNAKLVGRHLRVGCKVAEDMSRGVTKEEIVEGIEKVMGDVHIAKRAAELRAKFDHGFPATSQAALDAFGDFISNN